MTETITLSQTQLRKELYIYPNGDLSSCTEFTAVGGTQNWECVDEDRLTPDEDTTYVWWHDTSTGTDLYTMQNHTSEVGNINYIQTYARAKSNLVPQHVDGTYKILCSPDSVCSHTYNSPDKNLMTGYTTYSKIWLTNPSTATAWTWDNIDNLCSGIECSSPTVYDTLSVTLRPNGTGFWSNWIPSDGAGWSCVDETTANESDYVRGTPSTVKYDTYDLETFAFPAGTTILSVTVFNVLKAATDVAGDYNWSQILRTGGGNYYSSTYIASASWETKSCRWTDNPNTGVAWTQADIDALEIGQRAHAYTGAWKQLLCTQVYAIVLYSAPNTDLQIRTTQCYTKVNYDAEVTCTLNKPTTVSTNHNRSIKMFNFWNGSREVYDLNRSGKSIVLKGMEFEQGGVCDVDCPCERITCVRNMAKNGAAVTLAGLGFAAFNGNYRITQFGWKEVSERPQVYEWILQLQDSDL